MKGWALKLRQQKGYQNEPDRTCKYQLYNMGRFPYISPFELLFSYIVHFWATTLCWKCHLETVRCYLTSHLKITNALFLSKWRCYWKILSLRKVPNQESMYRKWKILPSQLRFIKCVALYYVTSVFFLSSQI